MITKNPQASPYQSYPEIAEIVQQFESGMLSRERWNHQAHLTIAIWYLSHYPPTEATAQIRTKIQHYNAVQAIQSTSTGGYHETLTRFWIAIAQHFLAVTRADDSIVERVNTFINQYGTQKQLFLNYYSFNRIMSNEARQSWVESDLMPISHRP